MAMGHFLIMALLAVMRLVHSNLYWGTGVLSGWIMALRIIQKIVLTEMSTGDRRDWIPWTIPPGTPGAGIGALGRFGHGPGHICLAIAPSSRACCSPLLRRHPKGSKAGLSVCTNQHFGPHRSLVWEAMALEVSRRLCLSPKARLGVVDLFVQYRVDVAGASDATPFSGNEKSARSHIHSWSKP